MKALQRLQGSYAKGEARALYELIMARRFGLSRTDILLGKDTTLSAKDKAELEIIVERVTKGEPVQYVLGSEEFCGRMFLVTPDVLIPRPETQGLVRLLQQHVPHGSTVLDVGTGSGCIAVTLNLAGYDVAAIDISEEALGVARRNASRLGARVRFFREDIRTLAGQFPTQEGEDAFPPDKGRGWDAIVSNPPYICESEKKEMEANVLDHEPHLALFVPDDDPLLFYRAIADYGRMHLAEGGRLFLETNKSYCHHVGELLSEKGFTEIITVKDDYDNDRFVCARRKAL